MNTGASFAVLTHTARIVFLGVAGLQAFICAAQSLDCNNPPAPDPAKTFLQNFLNPCYVIDLHKATPSGNSMTDLDQSYSGFFYHVNPKYELILLGEFPQARYMSITADDSHHTTSATIHDAKIRPLLPTHVNPFTPGVQYKEDQLYAVAVQFGGAQPATISPGCGFGGLDFHANVLDASKRHAGISWNGKPGLPAGFPVHNDAGPNTGGLLTVRQYMAAVDQGTLRFAIPKVMARDLSTGCAVPASKIFVSDPASVTPDHLLTLNQDVAVSWIAPGQVHAHQYYRSLQKPVCYNVTPGTALWFRPEEYTELPNPDAGYLIGNLTPSHVRWLVDNKAFLRVRFRLPTMPAIPCQGCTLTGSEQARYFSLSFFDNQKRTLASLGEFELVRDPDGYVTLIMGFGAPPPAHVTAANLYTYFDLSAVQGYASVVQMGVRHIIPSPAFQCSPRVVPFFTSEDNSAGGLMGEYVPVVDLMRSDTIPAVATPFTHPNSCGAAPPEAPRTCAF
jgi:hypothetical protein